MIARSPLRGLVPFLMVIIASIIASTGWLPRGVVVGAVLPQTDAEAAGVQIDQSHVFIVPAGDRIRIAEYYLVGNDGASTYEGAPAEGDIATTLAFELPEGATALSFDGSALGERYVGDGRRFADTQPIPPGTAVVEIGFSYELPLRDEIQLTRSLDVPVASMVLLVSGDGMGLVGDGLIYTGDIETGMGTAASYVAEGLESGVALRMELTSREVAGLTAPAAPMTPMASRGERDTGIDVLVGLLAVVVAGVVVWRLWTTPAVPPLPESARAIVVEIAALDAGYEEGRIPAESYRQERERLVREALQRVPSEDGERMA